jgi:hypothetical protein
MPRLYSRADARAAGMPLRTLLGRQFQKVLYDQYVSAAVPVDLRLRARAALNVSPPGACISHHTAAAMWGAAPPATTAVHVRQQSECGRSVRQGVQAHYSGLAPATTTHRGLPITTPEQTFLDLAAAGLTLVELVIIGDGLVEAKATTVERLVAAASEMRVRRHRLAQRAASLVREGVDSPMETRLRLLLILAGLPEPTVNVIVRGRDGEWLRRFDLCYTIFRLVVEYDGRQHAEDTRQWVTDIDRREELDHGRYRLVVVTRDGIYLEPERTLERVRNALIDCGAPDVPRRFSPEWRRHFL